MHCVCDTQLTQGRLAFRRGCCVVPVHAREFARIGYFLLRKDLETCPSGARICIAFFAFFGVLASNIAIDFDILPFHFACTAVVFS